MNPAKCLGLANAPWDIQDEVSRPPGHATNSARQETYQSFQSLSPPPLLYKMKDNTQPITTCHWAHWASQMCHVRLWAAMWETEMWGEWGMWGMVRHASKDMKLKESLRNITGKVHEKWNQPEPAEHACHAHTDHWKRKRKRYKKVAIGTAARRADNI